MSKQIEPDRTVSEAARELGKSEATIRAMVDRGQIRAVRMGGNKSRTIAAAEIARVKRVLEQTDARQ